MLQRREVARGWSRCHLDLACDDLPSATADHVGLGASVSSSHRLWTVMTDPSGVAYCLTSRRPATGRLPPGV